MNFDEYKIMYQVENQHWWYLGMAAISKAILNRWYDSRSNLRILDAGCGTGIAMQTYLADYGSVTGFDNSSYALNFCKKRGIQKIIRASIIQMPFKKQSFDLITSFDVLCNIPLSEDIHALKEFYRLLIPGGRILLRLPAYNWLLSQHDRSVRSLKRYNSKQIASHLVQAGFSIEHLSYANSILFPLALLHRLAGKIIRLQTRFTSDLNIDFRSWHPVLKWILQLEAIPVARMGLPYGLSIYAVGRKP